MKWRLMAILATVPLWACASKPDSTSASGSSGVSTALSVIETPLLIAFKIPVCLGSAPVLAPAAAVSAVVPFKEGGERGRGGALLVNGVKEACGPPYVATPHYGMEQ
jgi:hypothetical protein